MKPVPLYIRHLKQLVAAEQSASPAHTLAQRVLAAVGHAERTSIPELQRVLGADPRAIGAALRELGFWRVRCWSGPDYALTHWQRSPRPI